MKRNNQELREIYHKRQRRGMQDLRFMMLLFLMGLLLYMVLGYYCILQMQPEGNELKVQYLLYGIGTLIAWSLCIRMLWNFNSLGRVLFLGCTLASVYLYRDILSFNTITVESEVFKYMFLLLFGCKCMMILYCCTKILLSSSIRCIWNVDDLFDGELNEMDTMELEVQAQDEKEISPSTLQAQKHLKRHASYLGVSIYASVIVIFAFLALLKQMMPVYDEALSAIGYPLFNQCLFSLMMWSIPVIGMFVGKSWSPLLIYLSILGEILRIAISYQSYLDVLSNDIVLMEIKVLFVLIEAMRYMLLFLCCRGIWRSRVIRNYTHGIFHKQKT